MSQEQCHQIGLLNFSEGWDARPERDYNICQSKTPLFSGDSPSVSSQADRLGCGGAWLKWDYDHAQPLALNPNVKPALLWAHGRTECKVGRCQAAGGACWWESFDDITLAWPYLDSAFWNPELLRRRLRSFGA